MIYVSDRNGLVHGLGHTHGGLQCFTFSIKKNQGQEEDTQAPCPQYIEMPYIIIYRQHAKQCIHNYTNGGFELEACPPEIFRISDLLILILSQEAISVSSPLVWSLCLFCRCF